MVFYLFTWLPKCYRSFSYFLVKTAPPVTKVLLPV